VLAGLLLLLLIAPLRAQPVGEGDPAEWAKEGIFDPPPIDHNQFRQLELRYRAALKTTQPSNDQKDQLQKVFHYRASELARFANRFTVGRDVDKIVGDLKPNNVTPTARTYVLNLLADFGVRLTKEQPEHARLAGITLLRSLNASWNPDVPYAGSAPQLIKLLSLPDEDIYLKAPIAQRMGEILESGSPQLSLRLEIADSLSKEIRRLGADRANVSKQDLVGYDWYMMRLTEALGKTQRTDNLTSTLSYIDVLMEVLVDRKQNFMTRASAARALSRLPLGADVNLELINHETGFLGAEMSRAYQANPRWWMWGHVYLTTYLTYDAPGKEEIARNEGLMLQIKRPGLSGATDPVTAVRNLLLPLEKTVINNAKARTKLQEDDIKALEDWLKANVPADRKARPGGPEIPANGVTKPAEPQVNAR